MVWMKKVRKTTWHGVVWETLKAQAINFVLDPHFNWYFVFILALYVVRYTPGSKFKYLRNSNASGKLHTSKTLQKKFVIGLQWPWRQTWAWSWLSHSQRHCECHHGMPTGLQPTHYHSSEGITIIQAYAPTTDYDDDDTEDFYDQLQEVIDHAPKKDILVVLGDWNEKIGEDASKNWKGTCSQYCNPETHKRGLRLLEFAISNNLKVTNTNHLNAGHGTAQEETTTIRLTTSWSNASSQMWTLQRPEAFQELILEVTMSL